MASGNDDFDGDGSNPFALPPDEEIFKMREDEKRRKQEERRTMHSRKIWDKTTSSSRMGRTRKINEDGIPQSDSLIAKQGARSKTIVAAATAAISADRRREKENMSEFIGRKREMFLVQMMLDTKREEIQKLEHKAHMKEEALRKSELMLEEDAIRFDAFLKENDKQAHEALKNAEKEAKLKADKVQEIKKLKHAISLVQGEKSKCKEALDDCERYRKFLDGLTPQEYTDEQKEIKRQRQIERRKTVHAEKVARWEAKKTDIVRDLDKREDDERRRALKEGRMFKKKDTEAEALTRMPPRPDIADTPLESSGEELPMYFVRPQQLLDIFTQLEERNLFLIQHCQETEQQLEELRQMYRETERVMAQQAAVLEENITSLHDQIEDEEKKADQLKKRIRHTGGDDQQKKMLEVLSDHIKQVYIKCDFDAAANPSPLSMLTSIEGKLERMLLEISQMEPDYVVREEKEKEKERRERVREERIQRDKMLYEQRLKKSLERAQAPVKKKVGKQVMFRSAPLKRRVKTEKRDPKKEQELADLVFLT